MHSKKTGPLDIFISANDPLHIQEMTLHSSEHSRNTLQKTVTAELDYIRCDADSLPPQNVSSPGLPALPEPYWQDEFASVYVLPEDDIGPHAELDLSRIFALLRCDRANALLRPNGNRTFEVSVLSSTNVKRNQSRRIWRIDRLPDTEVANLIDAFSACRWGVLRSPVFRAWK